MAASQVTIKMDSEDREALKALLKAVAGLITQDEFLTILTVQGRTLGTKNGLVPMMADYFVGKV